MSRYYVVAFDGGRVGSHRSVAPLWILDDEQWADVLAEQIHDAVRRYLYSAEYEVHLELDTDSHTGEGSIGFGRYGTFSIAWVQAARAYGFVPQPPDREAGA